MAPSEDLRDRRASPNILGFETDLEASSGGKPARHQKAVPAAHLTFVIDCARGKQLSLAAPPAPPRAPGPTPGPATPPMKTYVLFCGESQPQLTQEAPLGGGHLAQVRGALPLYRGTVAPSPFPVSTRCSQGAPKAKESPLKAVPAKSSAWGRVVRLLKALSSCVCGRAD